MRRLVVLLLLLGTATWPGAREEPQPGPTAARLKFAVIGDNLYGSQSLADKFVPLLPREPRRLDIFADPRDDDAIHHFEHEWNEAVQVILLFFGLVNAGVPLHWHGTGTWAMLTAAMVGRPLGIMAAIWIALAAGVHLPRSLGWRELLVTALAMSSGFTFALLFATGVMPMGPLLDEIKLGAFSTILGAVAAIGFASVLKVGRFARRTHGSEEDLWPTA
jgi:Na+/H+ antiporter NhaA